MDFESTSNLCFHIGDFSGPLHLLLHLIEKNKMDIYDIPMREITEQYLACLQDLGGIGEEEKADFLVMASTLLLIKSRMLLPKEKLEADEEDPRSELVLRLLEYQRCRHLASTLEDRAQVYGGCITRPPLSAESLGISLPKREPAPLRQDLFEKACESLNERNRFRFRNLKDRVRTLLRRDRLPMRTQIRRIIDKLKELKKVFLFEMLPEDAGRPEEVSAFLAMLELLRMDQIIVTQKQAFSPLLMEAKPGADPARVEAFLRERKEDYV